MITDIFSSPVILSEAKDPVWVRAMTGFFATLRMTPCGNIFFFRVQP